MMNIENFKINKLHKVLNFDIQFRNNTIILLGENGSCKTTIINMQNNHYKNAILHFISSMEKASSMKV